MPNFYDRYDDRDTPNRADIEKMEQDNNRREREYKTTENRVERYLRDHPSASWAEAEYYTR